MLSRLYSHPFSAVRTLTLRLSESSKSATKFLRRSRTVDIKLTEDQINDLARPFIGMMDALKEFYKDPENERAYRKYFYEKHGYEPTDEVN